MPKNSIVFLRRLVQTYSYIKAFAEAYPDEEILQRSVGKLPWRHNIALIDKLKTQEHRLWYAQKAIENGWSRDILVYQIESGLLQRQGEAVTNFDRTLPQPQSDLAKQLIKDPYVRRESRPFRVRGQPLQRLLLSVLT